MIGPSMKRAVRAGITSKTGASSNRENADSVVVEVAYVAHAGCQKMPVRQIGMSGVQPLIPLVNRGLVWHYLSVSPHSWIAAAALPAASNTAACDPPGKIASDEFGIEPAMSLDTCTA